MDVFVWIIALCACFELIYSQNCKREQRCRISRIHGMTGADCYKKDMRVFPQCLSSNVEIIDLSYNRIRKVTKDDLTKYSDLKMLYLSDNVIVSIDEEAFDGKDDLNTLDLSLNAISKLPPVIFQLPSLKSLYLGQNLNMNIVEVIENTKPITSPLVQLDISYVMSEEPSELPDLGMLPFLTKYNISGNQLIFVRTKHFAGLCNLKILDTTNVSIEYEEPCHCWVLNQWLKARQVEFKPFECEISENECSGEVPQEDLQMYESCALKKEAIVQKSRMVKIIIPVVVTTVIILIIAVFYIIRRRLKQNRKRLRQNRTAVEPNLYDNILLNNKS